MRLDRNHVEAWLRAHDLDPDDVAEVRLTPRSVDGWDGASMLVRLYERGRNGESRTLSVTERGVLTYEATIPLMGLPGVVPGDAPPPAEPATKED